MLMLSEGTAEVVDNFDNPRPAEVFLLHNRLKIIDLSQAASQPMSSTDKRFHIVFNGEIYNYLELRKELEVLGHRFRSGSDTEVLLTCYIEWGVDCFRKLIGMFAFAILDKHLKKLIIARDYFGIKPVYYTEGNGCFAFASEIKALLEIPSVERRLDREKALEYLQFGITDYDCKTMYASVRQLRPGHYLILDIESGVHTDKSYWKLEPLEAKDLSIEEAGKTVREMFLRNIELHLRSDVPVGVALSGGLDSASIAMAVRHIRPSAELHTFTYVADKAEINELYWAKLVEQAGKTTGHQVHSSGENLSCMLEILARSQDEPYCSTSVIAQSSVFSSAQSAGIKVMLDGQGADELFGGYYSFVGARLASLLAKGDIAQLVNIITAIPTLSAKWDRICRSLEFLLPSSVTAPIRRLRMRGFAAELVNSSWFDEGGVSVNGPRSHLDANTFQGELLRNITYSSLPMLLRYEDRNSMLHSVESRVPFLTPALAQFAVSLPSEYLVDNRGVCKAVLREAMRGIVPQEILERRDKIGFATPESTWLLGARDWVEGFLSSEGFAGTTPLEIDAVKAEWGRIVSGRQNVSSKFWRCFCFALWGRVNKVEFQ